MTKKTIYISGQITGLPHEEYQRLFKEAETKLREEGYFVINPSTDNFAEIHELMGKSWGEIMAIDILILSKCNAIYMLRNWINSKGAKLERQFAYGAGIKVYYQQDFIDKK